MYNNLLEIDGESFIWDDDSLLFEGDKALSHDRLGSPLGMSPFGAETESGAFGFTGYMYDEISITYFAQAREYMPEVGRFGGRDILKGQVELPTSLNEYAYCHNNPIGFVDRNGMDPEGILSVNQIDGKNVLDNTMQEAVGSATTKSVEKVSKDAVKVSIEQGIKTIENARADYAVEFAKRIKNPNLGTRTLSNIEKTTASKLGANSSKISKLGTIGKLAGSYTGAAVVNVGIGLLEDHVNASSSSKKLSNVGVNAAEGIIEVAAGVAASGFVSAIATTATVAAAAGPIGIAAGIIVAAVFVVFDDQIKDAINSLD